MVRAEGGRNEECAKAGKVPGSKAYFDKEDEVNAIRKPSEIVSEMICGRDDISENKLQNDVVKRLRPLEDALGFRVVAIPNGGKRRAREGRQLKNRGLRAGFPDLLIISSSDQILIELKTSKGSLSAEQVEWHAWLKDVLFPVHVCTSVASVLTVLRGHGLKV